MLQLISESVEAKETFSIETTLSSRTYLKHLCHWKKQGFKVVLIFIALDSPDRCPQPDALAQKSLFLATWI